MKFWVVLSIVALIWVTTAIAQQAAKPGEGDVCWGAGVDRQCVPLSIVKSTFQGYQVGGPSPVSSYKQDLINIQSQLADTLKNFRQCEGILGPLQADAHGKLLQQQQQQLDTDNAKSAPAGTVWDGKIGKYVTAPVTAPTPQPPAGGRGGTD